MFIKFSFLVYFNIFIINILFAAKLEQDQTKRNPSNFELASTDSCEKNSSGNFLLPSALIGHIVGPQLPEIKEGQNPKMLRAFFSDGCSSSPDGLNLAMENTLNPNNKNSLLECCYEHDIKYWTGGTYLERKAADKKFGKCLSEKGFPIIAKLYKFSVDKFGGPMTFKAYRWGYGWNYQRPYSPLGPEEITQVSKLKELGFGPIIGNPENIQVELKNICSSDDHAFQGLSSDEIAIYNYLNKNLIKYDVIESFNKSDFNIEKRMYELKLKGCKYIWKISIDNLETKKLTAKSHCQSNFQ